MPVILAETSNASFPEGFAEGLSKVASETMGRPEDKFWIRLTTGAQMYNGGKKAEDIILFSVSGVLVKESDEETLDKWSGPLTTYASEKTGVVGERVFIQWHNMSLSTIARNGKLLSKSA